MSAGVGRKDKEGEQRVHRWWKISGMVAAIIIAVCLVGVIASYAVRTPLVLGHVLGPKIEAQHVVKQLQLKIGAIGGVGLTGVRFYDVRFAGEGGGGRMEVVIPVVDIYPDMRGSLAARRPVIGEVFAERVDIVGTGVDLNERNDAELFQATESAEEKGGWDKWVADELRIDVKSMGATISGLGEVATVTGLRAVLADGGRQGIDLDASAQVAGIDVDVMWSEDALVADVATDDIESEVGALPASFELDRISVKGDTLRALAESRQLDELRLELHGLGLQHSGGRRLELGADESTLQGSTAQIDWSAPTAVITEGDREYVLSQTVLAYRPDASGFSFGTVLRDGRGGRVELEGQWHLPTSLVNIDAWITDFAWDGTMPWPFGGEPPVDQGHIDGTFHGELDLVHRLISLDAALEFRDLVVEFPMLAPEPMRFEQVEVALPLTVDARGKTLSIVDGSAAMGGLEPFGFDARIIDAGEESHVFHLSASADELDASRLVDVLPPEMIGVIAEAKMEGAFGVDLELAGHSAFPESLILEVGLSGEVDVIREARWLERRGSFQQPHIGFGDADDDSKEVVPHDRWQPLASLPEYVPAAVLAAEDSAFFYHDGLDWKGLRMAMVENIEARALVRGGSTITQQVAKNVFLTHDRTLFRKLQESFFAWRVEQTLNKEEILELYLNVVEWGPEVYGISRAAQYFFEHKPEQLQPLQAAFLASILPNPIRFGGAIMAGYMPSSREGKIRRVLENMRFLEQLEWDQYYAAIEELDQQRVGSLEFHLCADDDTAPEDAKRCDQVQIQSRDGEAIESEQWDGVVHGGVGWMPLSH